MVPFRCIGIAVCLLGSASPASAQDAKFIGKWTGSYKNSLGDSKSGSILELKEDGAGKFTGTWDEIFITGGKRKNKDTIDLVGKSTEHSYQITANLADGVLKVNFLATNTKTKGTYTGDAQFERKK